MRDAKTAGAIGSARRRRRPCGGPVVRRRDGQEPAGLQAERDDHVHRDARRPRQGQRAGQGARAALDARARRQEAGQERHGDERRAARPLDGARVARLRAAEGRGGGQRGVAFG